MLVGEDPEGDCRDQINLGVDGCAFRCHCVSPEDVQKCVSQKIMSFLSKMSSLR